MAWRIKSYIPVDCGDLDPIETIEEAESELLHLQALQPENIYEIEEIEE